MRLYTKSNRVLLDAAMCAAAWGGAYVIRYGGQVPPAAARQILLLLPVMMSQIPIAALFDIYKFEWRYVNAGDALCVARVWIVYALVLTAISLLGGSAVPLLHIPISIIATMCVLFVVTSLSARLARRVLYERRERGSTEAGAGEPRRFLIVGAGMHGIMVAREMLLHRGIKVIGFLDDDPGKRDAIIAGVPVLGNLADLALVVEARDIDEVLVCISPKSRPLLHITDAKTSKGLPVRSRIMPTLDEILQSHSVISVLPMANRFKGSDKQDGQSDGNRANGNDAVSSGKSDAARVNVVSSVNGNGDAVERVQRVQSATSSIGMSAYATTTLPIQNKTILITGGAGFIGSSLAEKLVEHNRVVLFDQSFARGPIQYTSLLQHAHVIPVEGSVLETDLRSLLKEADVVVHAAAILGVNRVCNSARETLETNYVGTSRLLRALDLKGRIQRFVYLSTSEVFGVNSYRVDETSRPGIGPIAEARWSYAMSKLAGEHLVASYFRETRLPIVIVRPFNIFGPRRIGDYALRRFILSALQDQPLEIHGDGTQIRSWCYIEDFCSALLQMISCPAAIGEDFNIGNPGNTITILGLTQKVIKLTGSLSSVLFCESPFPDIAIRVPSLEKARRLLGYEPKYDLDTGLELTIQWHRENLDRLLQPVRQPMVAGVNLEERTGVSHAGSSSGR